MFARSLLFSLRFILVLVEFVLGLRIILRLFGANPATPFVDWVYQTTAPLMAPFQNIFPNPVIEGGFVIDFTAIFALFVYGFVAYLLAELIDFIAFKVRRYKE